MKIKIIVALFIAFACNYQAFTQNITTATNGLNKPNSSTVSLGGTLTDNTSIDLGASFTFNLKKSTADYFHMLNNGNLGIGTSSPQYKLDVNGVTRVSGNLIASGGNIDLTSPSGYANLQFHTNVGLAGIITGASSNDLFIRGVSGLRLGSGNENDKLVIAANGNVGIGNSNPTYKLDVSGTLRSGTFSLGSLDGNSEINAGGTGRLNINTTLVNALNGPSGTFNMGTYTQGLGTGTHLSVFNENSSGSLWVGMNLNYYSRFHHSPQTGAGFYDWSILGNTYRLFELGQGTVKMPVLSTGTGNGVQYLTIGEDGTIGKSSSGGSGSSGWSLTGNSITSANFIGTAAGTTHPLVFKSNGNEAFRVTTGGQVLVGTVTGTTSTDYKLAVGGAVIAEKIKVKLQSSGWPDYVFQKDYVLPSLKEVEAFIKQNKHLPDVPSAKEVEANGLDVGDNQAVLLKKIEELTLYMIEINKKVEKLEKENEILKAKSK